jgi:Carboxypeptidase regulatory-like domain/TonB dependent receptor-like, beta-barrel
MTILRMCALATCFIAFCQSLAAQDFGRIVGTITDSTGAAIPNISVTVRSVDTNVSKTFAANEQGRFTANNLAPGTYEVDSEAPHFKRFSQTGITVHVGETIEVPVQMVVGSSSESVTVTSDAPVLETATSSTGAVIESKLIGDLPLNERQPFTLAVLAPGVIPNRQIVNAAQPFNRAPNFSISGGRGDTNEILLDGTPNTIPEGSTGGFRAVTIFPTVEGMQEFKVQTNAMAAEYGGSGGGIVNIVTKSGTNEYHGAIFEFLRNSAMDSNGFFSNASSIPLASFKRNQFGAAFGGPVSVPKLYNGKNKTFLFVSWEDLKQLGGIPFTTTVPTDLQRQGNFGQTFSATGAPVIIYDPSTTAVNPVTGAATRTPFSGNMIPASEINPIAAKIMNLFPERTGLGLAFTHGSNFNKTYTQTIDDNRVDARLDQNIGDKQRIFFSYAVDERTYQNPNVYVTAGDPVQFKYPTDPNSIRAGYMYTITPSWIAEVRYAYNHIFFGQQPGSLGYDISQLGFPSYVVNGVQEKEFPRLLFSDLTGTQEGMGPVSNTMTGNQNSNVALININHTTGNHDFKFGAQIRRDYANRFTSLPGDLSFSFGRTFTQGPNALAASSTAGSSVADALLGLADTTTSSRLNLSVPSITHNWWHSYFVQDDWRINQRLTLNIGLRWDLQFPMVEEKNNFNWFTPNTASPIAAQVPSLSLQGATQFASNSQRNPYIMNMHDLAPRVGLAYRLTNTLVMRTGYGIFYAPNPYDTSANVGSGFSQSTPFVSTLNGASPIATISDPFPNGLVPPFGLGATPSAAANLGLAISYYQPKEPTPYMQQWNFGLQQQLGKSMAVEVTYDGMKGTHLTDVGYYLSQLTPSQLGPQVIKQVSNPFSGIINVGTLASPTVAAGQLMRSFPQYASVQVFQPDEAISSYNALLVKAEKRFSNGLTFVLSYTMSKLLDNGSGTESYLEPATGHQNGYDRRADYAVSDQDVPQRLVWSFTYALPFGKGRAFGNNWGPVVDHILGGWQATGVLSLQRGIPLSLTTTDTSQSGSGYLRPNTNGQYAGLTGSPESRLNKYFNTADFSQPAPYTFGNVGRNLGNLRGPGLKNLDFAIYKDIAVHERLHLMIRGEAFNLTNTPEFANPDTNLQDPTFGAITSQFNQPRQIQLGLRLAF